MTTFNEILGSLPDCPAIKGHWELRVMGKYPDYDSDLLRIYLFGKDKELMGYIDENGDAMWLTSTLPMEQVLEKFLEEIKEE